MLKVRKWITVLAVGVLVVAAGRGSAAAQQDSQQGPPRIDLQQLQKVLHLDAGTSEFPSEFSDGTQLEGLRTEERESLRKG